MMGRLTYDGNGADERKGEGGGEEGESDALCEICWDQPPKVCDGAVRARARVCVHVPARLCGSLFHTRE